MFTRVVENADGTFVGEYSEDGKIWNQIEQRKMFLKKLAESRTKGAYPKAKFLGTVKL
jgi:hypothetical protein